MSHRLVQPMTKRLADGLPVITSYPCLRRACIAEKLLPEGGELKLVENAHVGIEDTDKNIKTRGYEVQLRGWQKKSYFDTDSGTVFFDNWGGRWGHIDEMRKLEKAYVAAVEQETVEFQQQFADTVGATLDVQTTEDEIILTLENY